MRPTLVADLGLGPGIWLFLSLLCCLTLFFKFNRIWSVRNLDVLLLFALVPGMIALVGRSGSASWLPFFWLFLGSMFWMARCLCDLGMPRRPLLEPNLNAAGLTCLGAGVLTLLVAETISLPLDQGANRNPAEPSSSASDGTSTALTEVADPEVSGRSPLPFPEEPGVIRWWSIKIILSRILAGLSLLGLVAGLLIVGWRHFDRPIAGLSAATCFLLLPYTRVQVVDSGQLFPSALIVLAVALYQKPMLVGALLGLASGWLPACVGLIPLWAGFYRGSGALGRFGLTSLGTVAGCVALGRNLPVLEDWARALGARSLREAGLVPGVEAPETGSIWSGLDPSYRLPVLVLYLSLVLICTFWPVRKNLGELIALSASILIASQFWYLDKGGTLVVLYLPLFLLMVFRPNLTNRLAPRFETNDRKVRESLTSGA